MGVDFPWEKGHHIARNFVGRNEQVSKLLPSPNCGWEMNLVSRVDPLGVVHLGPERTRDFLLRAASKNYVCGSP